MYFNFFVFRSRGDNPIYNSDRFRITKTSNAVQLAVEHVQREDAGHYTLFARTKSNDVIRKDVQLIVEDRSTGDDPPIFLRRLVDLQVRVGSSSRLITEIRSSTDVKVCILMINECPVYPCRKNIFLSSSKFVLGFSVIQSFER